MAASENELVNTTATSLVTTAETAIFTFTVPVENNPAGQGLALLLSWVMTTGATVTAIQMRLRQGTGVAGTQVGPTFQAAAAAASNASVMGLVNDPTLAYAAGNTYTVTGQQVGATGNGTNTNCTIASMPVTAAVG